ncbi:Thiosulfate sulfurtransferase GlpE [Austwickia sp. TVS 96-490-7B]|uniref:rhodanese-like domain-containing protein n=1 Tax=Austwickia sp. TVS 96-490-7B TaxID=2830843 RepID=UPI001C56C321|nr:rhodanese-like domain-containing protein [Austwickia sp. TVS 96-490-7B]MBW3086841.1 Thiosulfate sulfurtransferase GlpE [Austwickia sp. TVS 96-490-7B]
MNVTADMNPTVPTVTHHDLPDNAVLIDVREHDEWDRGHAPHALHIPLGDLHARLDDLPDQRPLVIVCRSGHRSARAVAYLNDNGYDAVNLADGMIGWHQGNRPLVHDGPGTPCIH